MRSNFLLSLLKVVKLPLKLLVGWLGKNKPQRIKTEHERKLLAHVRNFAPQHYSYQKSIGKYKKRQLKKENWFRNQRKQILKLVLWN